MKLDTNQIEKNIRELMAEQRIPGLALAIVSGESVIYTQGFGVTSVEEGGVPVTPGTLFRIGSTTKPLTGTLVMRLVEAGLLDLDAPVQRYLPAFTLSDPEATGMVTLRRLLSHSAGLPSDFSPQHSRDPQGLGMHVRQDFPNYRRIAPPGKLFAYSNPGINLAGYIAEVVAGKPYAHMMTEQVFQPLGMARSTFDLPVAMTYPVALPHQVGENGALYVEHSMLDNSAYNPSGLAFSSAHDLANFALMQIHKGMFERKAYLQPETIAEMQRIQTPILGLAVRAGVESYQRMGYGLAFFLAELGEDKWVSHPGGIGSYVVFLEMVPNALAACILLANGGAVGMDSGEIFDPIFSQLLDRPVQVPEVKPVQPQKALWPQYTGLYSGENGIVQVESGENQLTATINGERFNLQAVSPEMYISRREGETKHHTVGFVLEADGPVMYIVVDGNVYQRAEDQIFTQMTAEELDRYTGAYHNGIAGDVLLYREGERLLFHLDKAGRTEPYIPLDETHFTGSFGPLVFALDEQGQVISFNINNAYIFERTGPVP